MLRSGQLGTSRGVQSALCALSPARAFQTETSEKPGRTVLRDAAGGVHCAEAGEQLAAGGQLRRGRRVQPAQAAAAGAAPRRQLQRQGGQVAGQNLRAGCLRQAAVRGFRPEPVTDARRLPPWGDGGDGLETFVSYSLST